MSLKPLEILVAATRFAGIGKDGQLPWPRLPKDMKFFSTTSTQTKDPSNRNAVIMGRKTWESIPLKFRPLPNRINIIISTQLNIENTDDIRIASSFSDAHQQASSIDNVESVYVIGGSRVFADCIASGYCTTVHLTQVLKNYDCDVFLPNIDVFTLTHTDDVVFDGVDESIPTQLLTYTMPTTKPAPFFPLSNTQPIKGLEGEAGYLSLINHIINHGVTCQDRTGVGTISIFGAQIRYNLRNGSFPLFTTKRVFFKGVAEELLWFIKGSTDANLLSEKGVRIWDGNGSREFLDKIGLTSRKEGDLGPVYGFQWRHFGAPYTTASDNYDGKGVDQLGNVIELIKTNPDSRRIILSAWNPAALPEMALPPCHVLSQFRVYGNELHCILYQRSCDMGLGVPFNVASYSLLTAMIAYVTGLVPGELVHVMADAHVYLNHVQPLQTQLERAPRPQPTLTFKRPKTEITTIDDFVYDDFVVNDYNPFPRIQMDMAV